MTSKYVWRALDTFASHGGPDDDGRGSTEYNNGLQYTVLCGCWSIDGGPDDDGRYVVQSIIMGHNIFSSGNVNNIF